MTDRDTRRGPHRPMPDDALLLTAIERCSWNMTRTARQLGVSRNTLYRRIRLLGIALPRIRRHTQA